MRHLEGKRVLFISPKFFGYEIEIKKKLEDYGAEVDFFDDRPQNTFFIKALIRINKNLIRSTILKHYNSLINRSAKRDYDFVFFLCTESIYYKSLISLKEQQTRATFILYLWDSIENRPTLKQLINLFDKVYSFDHEDTRVNDHIGFLPLFFSDKYESADSRNPLLYDLSFIGTAHSDRYRFASNIRKQCEDLGLKSYFFLYLQGKVMYYFRRMIDNTFTSASINEFSFSPLLQTQVVSIVKDSKAVLDIQHGKQTGLTMRTFEVLASRRKLITTNKAIKDYDFYHPSNILVVDRENPVLERSFFMSDYVEIDDNIINQYSLSSWIKKIFLN